MNNDAHQPQPPAMEDFDFNIDFESAFENIPIDIGPNSFLHEGNYNNSDGNVMAQHGGHPEQDARWASDQLSTNGQGTTRAGNENNISNSKQISPPAASGAAGATVGAGGQLFNAEETSMISQFFEKMNADPKFIFSPKLDEALLSLTNRDFTTPPPFSSGAEMTQAEARTFEGQDQRWNSGETYPTHPNPHVYDNAFGMAKSSVPYSGENYGSSFNQNGLQRGPAATDYPPASPTSHNTSGYRQSPQPSPNFLPHQPGASRPTGLPVDANMRNRPIQFGTDPSFQTGRFQPNLSVSSAIRSRSNGFPADPGETRSYGGDYSKVGNNKPTVQGVGGGMTTGVAMVETGDRREGFSPMAALNNMYAMSSTLSKNDGPGSSSLPVIASIPKRSDTTRVGDDAKTTRYKSASHSASTSPSNIPPSSSANTSGTPSSTRPRRENLSEDQKRINHISSEKRRRDLIKSQFKEMCSLVPKLSGDKKAGGELQAVSVNAQSKSVVLQIVYEYIVLMIEKNRLLRQFLEERQVKECAEIRRAIDGREKGDDEQEGSEGDVDMT